MSKGKDAPIFSLKDALAKFGAEVDSSRKGRKSRQKTISKSSDGRSLRATGRTAHLNFKAKPGVKAALDEHVGKGKLSLWLEEAIVEKLRREGIDIDA